MQTLVWLSISMYIQSKSTGENRCVSSLEPSVGNVPLDVIMGCCQRKGGWGNVRGCRVWTGIPRKGVVIYLSHPSDSNSYTLRCLYILTLGLQGHNLKRYPVKNVEKYKIKIDMFGGKANGGKGRNTRKRTGQSETIHPRTQITNNGVKWDALHNWS